MPQASPTTRELRSFLQNEYPIGRVRKITPLKKDEAAGVFEVMTNSRAYIFKYNGQRFRLRNEAEILRRLQPFDVAPRIILPDGRRSYVRFRAVDAFLYEKISGQSAPLSLGLLKKMGLLLSKMHRVPWGDYPFAPRSFSQAAKDWRDFYFFNLPAGQPAETFAALLTTMRSLPKLDDLPLAFTHGDPHAGNFVRDPDERFMLIDFELGSLAPPLQRRRVRAHKHRDGVSSAVSETRGGRGLSFKLYREARPLET